MANIAIWLSVKGSTPLRVKCAEDDLVEDLKEKVKIAAKPALDHVPVFNIEVYMSKEAYEVVDHKALKPGKKLSDIDGGQDDDHPLFVEYPDEPVAKRQRTGGPEEVDHSVAWGSLLQKGLKFAAPSSLVASTGASWDYDGDDHVCKQLRDPLHQLIENKGADDTKENHPLFLLFAGPGQGKSRLLTEFERLVVKCTEGTVPGGRVFSFLIGLENGVAPRHWETHEQNAERFVASRMLWQLKDANKQALADAGITVSSFAEFQKTVPADVSTMEVLSAVRKGEDLPQRWTAVIGIDGMQKMDGFAERSTKDGKKQPFYKTMVHVASMVNHKEGPLVIGLLAATESLQIALADSPQKRVNLMLPVIMKVNREHFPVFNTRDDPLLGLLVQDMGGHGRALEALEDAKRHFLGGTHAQWLHSVLEELSKRYQGAVTSLGFAGLTSSECDMVVEDMLAAALSGKVFRAGDQIRERIDPSSLALVRIEYIDADCNQYRICLPYVWLHLFLSMQNVSSELKAWRSTDYEAFSRPLSLSGEQWEEFNANFRVLRARAFPDGMPVSVGDLHRGARIELDMLRSASVVNRRLVLERARSRVATSAHLCGMLKHETASVPKVFSDLPMHTCPVKVLESQPSRNVSVDTCGVLLLNADKAPAGDAVLMLEEMLGPTESRKISEVWQEKQGMSRVDPQREWEKSCGDHDILVIACNDREQPPELPGKRLIFIGKQQFNDYYGMYAGRAFLNANRAKVWGP